VAAYLAFGLDEPIYGAVLLALILPQARQWFREPSPGILSRALTTKLLLLK
jgi:hypothetical protein